MKASIRRLRPGETELLKSFLYEAIFVPPGMEPPDRSIVELPELRVYYEDFGSGGADHCLVAEEDGEPVGAVWSRIMDDYGHVDDETPSLAIAVREGYRGRGRGTRLMWEMLALLKEEGFSQVSLSVQKANPAMRLYERLGFVTLSENEEEAIMVRAL